MSVSLTNKHRNHDVSHEIDAKAVKGCGCHARNAVLAEIHEVGPSFGGNHGKDIEDCIQDIVVAHISPAWLIVHTLHTHLAKLACDAIIIVEINVDTAL